ncbi:MAG: tyrosine--tRNA ligase [Candidatus Vogelbacteria bacterium CG22_combo_CG10-13_8_21_14_all_37_9]|uniref:Tyrosine--tRNA ligase n=1 Tax=Candidatus Vogelbacteria bacterium CG22_combo_CG10-13_8_21_14_all_37_9 TaxID=1975046 RepID=A0A2H0BK74_9BACT|nr:MAG: tyrosine--tRNA ligase [bacterium CG10_37_50]PIP58062.1 MAG: tyrosine--tRNA ligase [Candidatus Vogelbacteria bacterium CG22_combo_CG10-13_8_21_14_all_37_9]
MKKLVSDDVLKEFTERGIANIFPSREEFLNRLKTRKPLAIFLGIDPTGDTLHLGHGAILLRLKTLQDWGHKITILIGDFTAQIGDPDGKLETRTILSEATVTANYQAYREQIGKILNLKKTKFVFNKRWLAKLNFSEIIKLASGFTVGQMIERDMFQERLKKNSPIYLHEFLYPLMQGYDSVKLGVDVEIGGNDQTFNMLMGRTMQKRLGQEKFVIAVKLLTDPTGKKMGKTEGNMVTLADSPNNMYGKVMSWPDEIIWPGFEICTNVSLVDLEKYRKQNPRDAKMALAKELVKIYYGSELAELAETYFIEAFQQKNIPEKVLTVSAKAGDLLADILVSAKLIESKSEFKRLVLGRGICLESGEPVLDLFHKVSHTAVIKIGKKRFIKIEVKQFN